MRDVYRTIRQSITLDFSVGRILGYAGYTHIRHFWDKARNFLMEAEFSRKWTTYFELCLLPTLFFFRQELTRLFQFKTPWWRWTGGTFKCFNSFKRAGLSKCHSSKFQIQRAYFASAQAEAKYADQHPQHGGAPPSLGPRPDSGSGGRPRRRGAGHRPGNGGGSEGACHRKFWPAGTTPPQLRCRNVLNTHVVSNFYRWYAWKLYT